MGSVVWPGWERFLWLLSTRLTDGLQHGLGDLDRATATIAPDGSQAVVYVPTARTVTIDTSALAKGVQARWVDPSTGRSRPVDVQESYRTPGENGDGDGDWLLVFEE